MTNRVAQLVGMIAVAASLTALAATDSSAQERRRRGSDSAPAQPANPPVSREFATAYSPLNTAITARDWAAADTALTALKAVAVSPYERYLASQSEFRIASGTTNVPRQLTSVDGMIDSGGAPTADLARLLTAGGQLAYNAEQYAKAAQRVEAAQAAGSTVDNLPLLRVDSLIRSNQLDAALAYAGSLMDAGTATDQIYGIAGRALQEAGRDQDLLALLLRRVNAYPTHTNIRGTVLVYLQNTPEDRGQTIDLMRLIHSSGAMNDRRYYLEYVGNLVEDGLPAEAMAMIAQGRAAGIIPAGDTSFAEIEAGQRDKLADDRASLPGTERRAAAAADGRLARLAGDAYLGYANYAKAEEMYRLALSKSPADGDLINTRLGITRFGAGNYAGAMESFALVTGARGTIARMWEAVTRERLAAASAPTAPAVEPVPAATTN